MDPIQEILSTRRQLSALEREQFKQKLRVYVNWLLLEDFNRLVQLLYQVDVDEEKLKSLLREQKNNDAASIISDLLIKRQEEKENSRASFKSQSDIAEEDKW